MSLRRTALAATILVAWVVGLVLRLPNLGDFLTPDEQRIWTTLTAQFLDGLMRGDWAATATSGYPGVTTTWAGSMGLTLQWLLDRPMDVDSLAGMAQALLADPNRMDMLPWLRLGVALLCTLGLAAIFLLSRRLFDRATALLATGLLSFDAFLLAHTRILNTDPLLAIFLTVAWLALLLATASHRRRDFILSGGSFGLALLAKTPALALVPLVAIWIVGQQRARAGSWSQALRASAADLFWFGWPALLVVVLLWPALWVAPAATLRRVWEFGAVLSQTEHELGNYWLGRPAAGPGVLFYPAVVLWRSSPVTLLGLGLAVAAVVRVGVSRVRARAGPGGVHASAPGSTKTGLSGKAAWGLLVYILWFGLVLSLSPKKFDRYLLPAFPAIDILAAWGWVSATAWIVRLRQRSERSRDYGRRTMVNSVPSLVAIAVLIAGQAWLALANLPTYLTAYNPLVGGIATAHEVMLVGWGEGMEEAATFLNRQRDHAASRAGQPARYPTVAAWYGHNVFGPFYGGQSYDLVYDLPTARDLYAQDVDFVVTYISQIQRALLDPSIDALLAEPLMVSRSGPVALAQVYAWPKPFGHTADRELGPSLRLLGWEIGEVDDNQGSVPLTLYWDGIAIMVSSRPLPPVLAWIKDASGEVWAATQAAVLSSSSRLSDGWLEHPVIAQDLRLELPVGLLAGPYQLEMAPEAGASQALGEIDIQPTRLGHARDLDVPPLSSAVRFGDGIDLLGYRLDQGSDALTLDLLWTAQATPPAGVKVFVHLVDQAGQIVAQHDGTLAALPGQQDSSWQRGDLIRQRVRLPLQEMGETGTDLPPVALYVGLYMPNGGQRLALLVDDNLIRDRRYLLATISGAGRDPGHPATRPPGD